jgi:hypothetical protein
VAAIRVDTHVRVSVCGVRKFHQRPDCTVARRAVKGRNGEVQ